MYIRFASRTAVDVSCVKKGFEGYKFTSVAWQRFIRASSSRFLFQSRSRLRSAGTASVSGETGRADAWSASAGMKRP